MDSRKIEELLNRYWECETSLEEETQLREYFQRGNIPAEHKEAAALFRYFYESRTRPVPEVTFDTGKLSEKASSGKWVQLLSYSGRIAAGIAVLVAAAWFIRTEIQKNHLAQNAVEEQEVKLAFEQTKKALMMISSSFGKAEEEAKKINLFNEAQDKIQNNADTQSAKN